MFLLGFNETDMYKHMLDVPLIVGKTKSEIK